MSRRSWVVLAAVVVGVGVLAWPLVPASAAASVPFAHTETMTDETSGACAEVSVSGTFSATAVGPVLGFLPWNRWVDAAIDDIVIVVDVPESCPGIDQPLEADRLTAYVFLGDEECVWSAEEADAQGTAGEFVTGCGDKVWQWTDTLDEDALVLPFTWNYGGPIFKAGTDGCLDVAVAADVVESDGDSSIGWGIGGDIVEAACLG